MLTAMLSLSALVLQAGASSGSLTFTAPPAWHTRTPSSSMRAAEFVIPKAPGDAEDAELIVYYFGGGGGSAAANIDRWVGQMRQPDNKPSADRATRETRTINGLNVSLVDVTGTYVAEMRPGAAEHYNKAGFRLRAAVVDTPKGSYYLKLTGPERAVAAAAAAYDRFLSSLAFKP